MKNRLTRPILRTAKKRHAFCLRKSRATFCCRCWVALGAENLEKIFVQIIMVGVGCVGKSTIGKQLGKKLKVDFIDFDEKVENHFALSIERIKNKYLSENSFRQAASVVLRKIFTDYAGKDFVLAMPPGGLRDYYWRIIKAQQPVTIEITDDPKNILKRISYENNIQLDRTIYSNY